MQGVVVVDVDPAGPARLARLRPGQLILEINRRPVDVGRGVSDARSPALKPGDVAVLLVFDPVAGPAHPRRHRHRRRFMTGRILVIDDEAAIRDTMRMILEYEGYECMTAGSGAEGLTAAEREAPDLVFLDIKMPGMDGLETLSRLRGMNDALPVVIVSAHGTASTALEAGRLGAFRFIEKPLSKDYVLDAIREGLELGSLQAREPADAVGARDRSTSWSAAVRRSAGSWTRCSARRRRTRPC